MCIKYSGACIYLCVYVRHVYVYVYVSVMNVCLNVDECVYVFVYV